MKKIAIFDLDGTLIDTAIGLNACMNIALQKKGLQTISIEQTRMFVGNGIYNYVIRSVTQQFEPYPLNDRQTTLCQQVYEDFIDIYPRQGLDGCSLYNGVDKILSTLKKMGIRLALLSNKAQSATENFYAKFLSSYSFDLIFGQKKDIPLKPAPDGLIAILNNFNLTKNDAVLIGDGETDYLTAKAANVDCISALWGYRSKTTLEEVGARVFADNPPDILKILGINAK